MALLLKSARVRRPWTTHTAITKIILKNMIFKERVRLQRQFLRHWLKPGMLPCGASLVICTINTLGDFLCRGYTLPKSVVILESIFSRGACFELPYGWVKQWDPLFQQ